MVMSSRSAHHQPSQGDLDLLALLTSDSSSMGPLSSGSTPAHGHTHPHGPKAKKLLPRRENPVDALLISAVLAGSGPVTRHHLGHGVGKSQVRRAGGTS
jgi:GTP cyclohydrolase II